MGGGADLKKEKGFYSTISDGGARSQEEQQDKSAQVPHHGCREKSHTCTFTKKRPEVHFKEASKR